MQVYFAPTQDEVEGLRGKIFSEDVSDLQKMVVFQSNQIYN